MTLLCIRRSLLSSSSPFGSCVLSSLSASDRMSALVPMYVFRNSDPRVVWGHSHRTVTRITVGPLAYAYTCIGICHRPEGGQKDANLPEFLVR
jgi:hypothetical protein